MGLVSHQGAAAVKNAGLPVVGQFAVAALYERRNPLNQKPAVIDQRYKKPK